MSHLLHHFALAALLFYALSAPAQIYENVQVVKISDGDTITARTADGEQLRVRIAGIDAPESQQIYGAQSRLYLVSLLKDADPKLDCYKKDRYRRHICRVFVSGKDVGLEQVKAGAAWWYREYAKEQTREERQRYESAEKTAIREKVGLWAKEAVEPSQWRAQKRNKQ